MAAMATSQEESTKRHPAVRIPHRLIAHLKRWKRDDKELTHVVHFKGKSILRVVRAFRAAREVAKLDEAVIPHTLQHTCITSLMQNGVPLNEVSGFAGVTVEVLETLHNHHRLDHQAGVVTKRMVGTTKPKRKQMVPAQESTAA